MTKPLKNQDRRRQKAAFAKLKDKDKGGNRSRNRGGIVSRIRSGIRRLLGR